jgi:hypothetical protein
MERLSCLKRSVLLAYELKEANFALRGKEPYV